MSEFPTQVYICPGVHQRPGGTFSTVSANSQEELDDLLHSGYSATLPEAIKGPSKKAAKKKEKKEKKKAKAVDNSAPTREEAKAKAKELGIEHASNIPTKKLIELINAKLDD